MQKIRDHYFEKAKQEKYFARSIYKLEEIDKKYRLFKKGVKVLDIGCSPGSWSQYMLKKVGTGSIVGIDISNSVRIHDNRFTFIQGNIFDFDPEFLKKQFGSFDIITSDAAPKTTGNKFSDAVQSLDIVSRVFSIAEIILPPGGTAIAKVFQGEDLKPFIEEIKNNYKRVSLFKPKSSRKESREIFIIAHNRRKAQ
ncbi:MAG TPA: RlmE family RNA methyltransferase [Spirochaetes bacterium]|nr:RlmE family RNA methyltransferase [Spirochaetota bacterium]